jgi:succinate dehydrogenase hydrophobic anchor subunit
MEPELWKWLAQQTPAVVIAVFVIWRLFKLIGYRDEHDKRIAEELKGVAETLSSLSTTLGLLFNRIKGGGGHD